MSSIWNTLAVIDCNKHIEKKGKFSYLSWTWAVAMVKEHYPQMTHRPLDDVFYPDGSMEVRCEVTIDDQSHPMWLPVLDHMNKPIKNPGAFDINTARMRCLVKNLAVNFGLGHYIYAGESTPQEPVVEETAQMIRAGAEINALLEVDDFHGAAQVWDEWEYSELQVIGRAPSKGGQLTTENRGKLKSTEFRLALNEVRGVPMDNLGETA